MTAFVPAKINDRWELMLPDFRERFHAERPQWEVGRVEHCAERMQPGMIVWDIGAEHGDFSALYAQWCGPGVVLIEPSLGYWPCIRATFAANDLPPPVECFVGFASRATEWPPRSDAFTAADEDAIAIRDNGWPHCAWGEIIEDFGFRHLAQQTASTPQTRIDDLAAERGYAPDAIVMDIEGAEWDALNGLSGLDVMPLVWVSVHEPTMLDWYDKTLDDIHSLMAGFDYRGGVQLPAHGEGETFWFYEPR